MSASELQLVRAQAEQARADTLEVMVTQREEHAATAAEFQRRLAEALTGMGTVPAETARHLLLAASAFTAQGGPKP